MILITLTRIGGAALFFAASAYCVVSYSSFAYYQFLAPGVVRWPAQFAAIFHYLYWFWLLLTAATLWPHMRRARHGWLVSAHLLATAIGGLWLLYNPVLATVDNTPRSLNLALLATTIPLALAPIDHLTTTARCLSQRADARVFRWAIATALLSTAVYACAAIYRWESAPALGLSISGLVAGIVTALALHVLVFLASSVAVTAALASSSSRGGGFLQYALLLLLVDGALTLIVYRVIFGAIAFTGGEAIAIAAAWAAVAVGTWSSLALAAAGRRGEASEPMSLLFAPLRVSKASLRISLIVVTAVAALFVAQAVELFDWDFLLQKTSVLGVWAVAAAVMWWTIEGSARVRYPWTIAAAITVASLGAIAIPRFADGSSGVDLTLDRYSALDPSYRLISTLSRRNTGDAAAFYGFLRAHSTIAHVDVAPIDIDFVKPLPPPEETPPHIFLFVIDSLRRDFLSPYNPEVTFTPSIAAFARESIVFERPFSRYGATGLAVPSIWTGGMTLHKQYIAPYAPMNTLSKLLDAGGYRRIMSVDPIAARLFDVAPAVERLDAEVKITDYRLCRTLGELQERLLRAPPDQPVFAYSLPQDIHVSNVFGRAFPESRQAVGLFPPVAARLEQIDRCFGEFIAFLKAQHLYEESVVILTSDHGDSMGEEGRWGHAYTVFPEVMQVPLIMHVPARIARTFTADPRAVSFTSDISPTLYALLGYDPADLGSLYGAPLLVKDGRPRDRSNDRFLLASSYGAVYGLLSDDGKTLYIADAINGRDYAYDLSAGGGTRVGVTDQVRARQRELIRADVEKLALQYRFVPR